MTTSPSTGIFWWCHNMQLVIMGINYGQKCGFSPLLQLLHQSLCVWASAKVASSGGTSTFHHLNPNSHWTSSSPHHCPKFKYVWYLVTSSGQIENCFNLPVMLQCDITVVYCMCCWALLSWIKRVSNCVSKDLWLAHLLTSHTCIVWNFNISGKPSFW